VSHQCECTDPGCKVHVNEWECCKSARCKVSRYDYETNGDHFYMCNGCVEDAIESGVFS